MPVVEITKKIDAPVEKVWAFLSDIKKAPEWVTVMQSLVETTDNPVREGSVYREKSKIGPNESETEWRITRYDSPHIQVHECNASDFAATLTMKVEKQNSGSLLTHRTEYQLMPVFRPLGWLIESVAIRKIMNKNLEQTVENCKRMIEEKKKTQ